MPNALLGLLTAGAQSASPLALAVAPNSAIADFSPSKEIKFNSLYSSIREDSTLLGEPTLISPATLGDDSLVIADLVDSLKSLLSQLGGGNGLPQSGDTLPVGDAEDLLKLDGILDQLTASAGRLFTMIEQQHGLPEQPLFGSGDTEGLLANLAELEQLLVDYAAVLNSTLNPTGVAANQGVLSDQLASLHRRVNTLASGLGLGGRVELNAAVRASGLLTVDGEQVPSQLHTVSGVAVTKAGSASAVDPQSGLGPASGNSDSPLGDRRNSALAIVKDLKLLRQAIVATADSSSQVLAGSRSELLTGRASHAIHSAAASLPANTNYTNQRAVSLSPQLVASTITNTQQADSLSIEELLSRQSNPNDVRSSDGFTRHTHLLQQAASSTNSTTEGRAGTQFMSQLSLPTHHAQWANQLAQRVHWFAAQGIAQAELQLNPQELGPLQVRVDTAENAARVTFTAQNTSTRELIEAHIPRLRDLFSDQGLELLDAHSQSFSSQQQETGGNASAFIADAENMPRSKAESASSSQEMLELGHPVELYYGRISTYV